MNKVNPPEPFIDHFGKKYIDPCSLDEALAAAEELNGMKMAVSTPGNPQWIVICFDDEVRYCRIVNDMTGHGGSVMETGEWRDVKDIPKSLSWRPA